MHANHVCMHANYRRLSKSEVTQPVVRASGSRQRQGRDIRESFVKSIGNPLAQLEEERAVVARDQFCHQRRELPVDDCDGRQSNGNQRWIQARLAIELQQELGNCADRGEHTERKSADEEGTHKGLPGLFFVDTKAKRFGLLADEIQQARFVPSPTEQPTSNGLVDQERKRLAGAKEHRWQQLGRKHPRTVDLEKDAGWAPFVPARSVRPVLPRAMSSSARAWSRAHGAAALPPPAAPCRSQTNNCCRKNQNRNRTGKEVVFGTGILNTDLSRPVLI